MRWAVIIFCLFVLTACVSKKEADAKARDAYMAGQAAAAKQWQAERPDEVVVRGPVTNPVVPYQDGLTLSQAIVTANYTGYMNPMLIRVIRDGQIISEMKGSDLLQHKDVALQPGDIIDVVP